MAKKRSSFSESTHFLDIDLFLGSKHNLFIEKLSKSELNEGPFVLILNLSSCILFNSMIKLVFKSALAR